MELNQETLEKVAKRIFKEQKASISMLQRLFRFDYPKAKEYIDKLCKMKIIKKRKDKYKVNIQDENELKRDLFENKYHAMALCNIKDNNREEIRMAQYSFGYKRSEVQPYYDKFFKALKKYNKLNIGLCTECGNAGRVYDAFITHYAIQVYEEQSSQYKEQFGQHVIRKHEFKVCPKCGKRWHTITIKSNPNMDKFFVYEENEGESVFCFSNGEPIKYLEVFFKDDPTIKELSNSDVITLEEDDLPF